MPYRELTKQGVRRHDADQTFQCGSAQCLGPYCQSSTLLVGQAQASPTELLTQDAVLLAQILDDVLLLPTDPASNAEDEKLQYQSIHATRVAAMQRRAHWLRASSKNGQDFGSIRVRRV